MGIRNYLIEGGSGVGKTTIAEELERRGYHVVHGDRVLAYYGDPATGEPVEPRPFADEAANIRWAYDRWLWPVAKVREIAADRAHPVTFFCGHSANNTKFVDLFDLIFTLEIDPETLDRRLRGRGDDEFGGRPLERALVLELHQSRAGIPPNAIGIDASLPAAQVVDAILARCALPARR